MENFFDWSFFFVTSTSIERGVGLGQAVAAAEGSAGDGARPVCLKVANERLEQHGVRWNNARLRAGTSYLHVATTRELEWWKFA